MITFADITVVPPEVDSRISTSETAGGRAAVVAAMVTAVVAAGAMKAVDGMDEVPTGRGSIFVHLIEHLKK